MKWMKVVTTFLLGTFLVVSLGACSPEPRRTGVYIDDASITTRVKTALIGTDETRARNIEVNTYKGVVQLSGFVGSEAERKKAGEVAQSVNGVVTVKNDLLIR
jgi:osmotically-inducible protein OsmY